MPVIMSGQLGEWTVDDLLQIVRITQKTTTVAITGHERSGVLYFRGGHLVDGQVQPDGPVDGDMGTRLVDCVYLLCTVSEGAFEFGTHPVPQDGDMFDVKDILEAVADDLARDRRLRELGVVDGARIVVSGDTVPATMDTKLWEFLASMIPPFSLWELEQRLGRRAAVARVTDLHEAGILEVVEQADPRHDHLLEEVAASLSIPTEPEPAPPPAPEPPREDPPLDGVARSEKRMRELVAPSDTTLVANGVLDDLRVRFRYPSEHPGRGADGPG